MNLIEELEHEVQDAMKAGDTVRRDALRLILASLKSAEKDLMRELTEYEELQVLQRERKKRLEAIEAFENAGRDAQADKEEAELDILEDVELGRSARTSWSGSSTTRSPRTRRRACGTWGG